MMFGNVEVTRVMEGQAPFAPTRTMFPDSRPESWRDNESWLAPDFWSPDDDLFVAAMQTWVLRSEGRTILVDTGIGRFRPPGAPFDGLLRTSLVDGLADVGIKPADVDIVVNTHLHSDHVGWNTSEQDGVLVPTFGRARYLIPAADNAATDPNSPHYVRRSGDTAQRIFGESVLPVHQAGQAVLWEGSHRIDGNLVLEAVPGHTPGSSLLRLESAGERAVFVGDILHSPVQIPEPDCNSCFCQDPEQARRTRRSVLERAADTGEVVVPAHFGGHGALEVRREGSAFAISRWAAFS
ncbi:MBL fold metallo-hydrolase [Streptomyces sp. NBC_00344]|uniref:MBL fold metallo-hydrolase n=1 Tax=Streptomyces sp. NBC_00344 TaxID=2975720 RepID=UPI002E1F2E38